MHCCPDHGAGLRRIDHLERPGRNVGGVMTLGRRIAYGCAGTALVLLGSMHDPAPRHNRPTFYPAQCRVFEPSLALVHECLREGRP